MEAPQITAAAQIKNTRSCLKRPPREEDFLRVERFKPGFTQLWRELYVPVLPERLQYPKKRKLNVPVAPTRLAHHHHSYQPKY